MAVNTTSKDSTPKGPGGRPSKFTKDTRDKILHAISKGAPYVLACKYARIDTSTWYKWKDKAVLEKLPEYIQFFKDLDETEARTSIKWLDVIDSAMHEGVWQAATWKLERVHHKYFSPNAAIIEMNERLDRLEGVTKDEKGSDEERSEKDD